MLKGGTNLINAVISSLATFFGTMSCSIFRCVNKTKIKAKALSGIYHYSQK